MERAKSLVFGVGSFGILSLSHFAVYDWKKNSTWQNRNCLDDARMSGKFNKKFLEKTDSQKKLFNLARI
jgi:hypothetical protein